MDQEFLQLSNIGKQFSSGEGIIHVLDHINLTIKKGEMIAIVGASGSGKSTLMNILGCLDHPSSGNYRISGQEVAQLDSDQLSNLRRHHFGFIFQRYHLIGELSILNNIEMPAIYANKSPAERRKRALYLLERLGLKEKANHKPSQLSGGQQQRASIARALINDANIILADEPTGALDQKSGEDVLNILEELHREGRTIILVTHDMAIAKRAERIITISDGVILSDCPNESYSRSCHQEKAQPQKTAIHPRGKPWVPSIVNRFFETFWMSFLSMNAHRMRSFLTMLGVIIGVAAVITVVALGNGTKKQILENINRLGNNSLTIFAGKNMADVRANKITTLVEEDANALAMQDYAAAVTPVVRTTVTVRQNSIETNASLFGVNPQFFKAQGYKLIQGTLFNEQSMKERSLDLVIEKKSAQTLFPSDKNPIGKTLFIGRVIARIVGIIEAPEYSGPSSQLLSLYLPYTSVQTRFLGSKTLQYITLLIADHVDSHFAEASVKNFLTIRHGVEDFFILNSEDFLNQIMENAQILTLLVTSIAVISLIIGGIGVMNIMLVTVSERINEIGVRMAVGARQRDILQQFLIESVVICLIGGLIGIVLGLAPNLLSYWVVTPFSLHYSASSLIIAFIVSVGIGVSFGYLPARNASKLSPITALSRD